MEYTEIDVLTKFPKIKKKLILAAVVILAIASVFVATWLSGRNSSREEIDKLKEKLQQQEEQIDSLADMPIVVNPVAPEIVMDMLHSEISEIGELASIEYLFTDAAKFSDSKKIKDWNIPFTEKSFTLKWNGVIKAGIDLEKIHIEVNESEKKIVISVPSAQILSYEIDTESVEVLDEKDNILNNLTINDKVNFDVKTEEAMKERAIENGILDKAQKNAEDIIKRMITGNPDLAQYDVEFVILEE